MTMFLPLIKQRVGYSCIFLSNDKTSLKTQSNSLM